MKRAREDLERVGLDPSSAQIERLAAYEGLLARRGMDLGLVAQGDRDRLWERHLLDSARAAAVLPASGRCLDLGSGGGLPGVVVAILRPSLSVKLVERRNLRAAFLEHVVRTLGLLNVDVVAGMAGDLAPADADAATARAFAPLPQAWETARELLRPGGILVYFAGERVETVERLPGAERIDSAMPDGASGPLVIIQRGAEAPDAEGTE